MSRPTARVPLAAVIAATSILATAVPAAPPVDDWIAAASALRDQGDFDRSSRFLNAQFQSTSGTLAPDDLRAVEFEIERLRRIRRDYTVTRPDLLAKLQAKVKDFTTAELEKAERDGLLDSIVTEGKRLYVGSSAENLVLRTPALQTRRVKPSSATGNLRKLYDHMRHVREAAHAFPGDGMVLPQDYEVTYTLTVPPNGVPDGGMVSAWLPYARAFPHQTEISLLASEPSGALPAPPEAPHRTLYLERPAVKDTPTRFSVHFSYRCRARWNDIDPAKVLPYRKDAPDYAYSMADRKPHIDLSDPDLKQLSAQIVGDQQNPFLAARLIYDWIARNTVYQYAREYSTIECIPRYVAQRRAGDCGQHAMLFIALCRASGIPARWTTGWECFEAQENNNMHDWAEFLVEPYGWLPADVDMAVNAISHAEGELATSESLELADMLFARMDHYRLTTNADFSAPLFPAKTDFRSETVDFQRGEVECDGKNLYFGKWKWSMEITPVSPARAAELALRFVTAPPPPSKPAPAPAAADLITGTAQIIAASGEVETAITTAVNQQEKTRQQRTSGVRVALAPAAARQARAARETAVTTGSAAAATTTTAAASDGTTSAAR